MKTTRAEVITAEEATWPKSEGSYVVYLFSSENGERTGQHWSVFQGTKKACENLAARLNEGLSFLDFN